EDDDALGPRLLHAKDRVHVRALVEMAGEELLQAERAPDAEEEPERARLRHDHERPVLHAGLLEVLDELREELALLGGRTPRALRSLHARARRAIGEDEPRERE